MPPEIVAHASSMLLAMQGREWLSQRDADVLVFGETIEKGALNLHFLAPKGSIDFRQNAFKLESGLLKEEFKEALAAQLLSFVFATVDISDENRGRYLIEALRPVAARLEQLLLYPPSGLSARQLAAVQLARGVTRLAVSSMPMSPSTNFRSAVLWSVFAAVIFREFATTR
jgi:hypothetical protein